MTARFPTRKQEAWRYADLEALQPVWEQASEREEIAVLPRQSLEQLWLPSGDSVEVRRVLIRLGAGAKMRLFVLNSAEQYGRIELTVDVCEGSEFELFAANIGTGLSTNEIVTNVRHLEPGGRSRQAVRSVLGGKAVGTYLGKVEVARDAQKSDAEQSVKALLLDRGTSANAKPELEIFADDVKCAHGASVGELDEDQLFYLETRGLPPAEARSLLLEGFIGGLWDSVADGDERERISTAARDALRRVSSSPTGGGGPSRTRSGMVEGA